MSKRYPDQRLSLTKRRSTALNSATWSALKKVTKSVVVLAVVETLVRIEGGWVGTACVLRIV